MNKEILYEAASEFRTIAAVLKANPALEGIADREKLEKIADELQETYRAHD